MNRSDNYRTLRMSLEQQLRPMPVVDMHTHLPWRRPGTAHLADLLTYQDIATELETCGISHAQLFSAEDPDERVRAVAKHWKCIGNCTTAWCFLTMARDLFGWNHATLSPGNVDELLERSNDCLAQPGWWQKVLRDHIHAERSVLTLEFDEDAAEADGSFFAPSLRIDSLLNAIEDPDTAVRLSRTTGMKIDSLPAWKNACHEVFRRHKEAGCTYVSFSLPANFVWKSSNISLCAQSFAGLVSGRALGVESLVRLRSHLFEFYVELATEFRLPVVPMIGVMHHAYEDRAGESFPRDLLGFETKMIRGFYALFNDHPDAVFDFILLSPVMSHELTATAKVFPNVHVSGHWWYAFHPHLIRQQLRERLEILPVRKTVGFFSNARHVEWAYGKLMLYKKELSRVLAEHIDEGYWTEEQALEIAQALLSENAKLRYAGLTRENSTSVPA